MNEKGITTKQLVYMKLAYEVQQIAMPYVKKGGYSLSTIYLKHVIEKVPVCMNTFRKMMKEDARNPEYRYWCNYRVFCCKIQAVISDG